MTSNLKRRMQTLWQSNTARRILSLALALAMLLAAVPFALQRAEAFTTTPYYDWKQYAAQWADVTMTNKTLREVGCLATATAILAVHAGLKNQLTFDPGVFALEMRLAGGFNDSNDMVWSVVPQVISGFNPEAPWTTLTGTQEEKTAQLGAYLDQGYYAAVAVRSGGHWVALRSVSNGTAVMMDPGSEAADLFAKYDAAGVTRAALFRKGSSGGGSGWSLSNLLVFSNGATQFLQQLWGMLKKMLGAMLPNFQNILR